VCMCSFALPSKQKAVSSSDLEGARSWGNLAVLLVVFLPEPQDHRAAQVGRDLHRSTWSSLLWDREPRRAVQPPVQSCLERLGQGQRWRLFRSLLTLTHPLPGPGFPLGSIHATGAAGDGSRLCTCREKVPQVKSCCKRV